MFSNVQGFITKNERKLHRGPFLNIFLQLIRSGGELLELRLLDTQLLDTFGSKSIAQHKIDKLLKSS